MGMFDTLQCEIPLPDGFKPEDGEFQTKDLDCCLETYTLTAEGKLLGPDGEDKEFHGWLNFYSLGPAKDWHEYRAKFTDGRLVQILVHARSPV